MSFGNNYSSFDECMMPFFTRAYVLFSFSVTHIILSEFQKSDNVEATMRVRLK
jgi:hypothetical protein